MQFEVFIPAPQRDGLDVTLNVDAENWMDALKVGLERCGEPSDFVRNVMCDIQFDGAIHVTDIRSRRVFKLREHDDPIPDVAPLRSDDGGAATMVLQSVHREEAAPQIGATIAAVAGVAHLPKAAPPARPEPSRPEAVTTPVRAPEPPPLEAPVRPAPSIGQTMIAVGGAPERAAPVPAPTPAPTLRVPEPTAAPAPEPAPAAPAAPAVVGETIAAIGGVASWTAATEAAVPPPFNVPAPEPAPEPIKAPAPEPEPARAPEPVIAAAPVPAPARASAPAPAPMDEPEPLDPPTAAPAAPVAPRPPAEDPWPDADALAPKARVASSAHKKAEGAAAAAIPAPEVNKAPKTVMMEAISLPEAKKMAAEAKRRAVEHAAQLAAAPRSAPPAAEPAEPRPDPQRGKATVMMEAPKIGQVSGDFPARPARVLSEKATPTGEFPVANIGRAEEAEQVGESILEDIFLDIYDLFEPSMTMESAVEFILNLAVNRIAADSGAVIFALPDGSALYVADSRTPNAEAMRHKQFPIGQGIVGFSTREGVTLALSAGHNDPRFASDISHEFGLARISSILCAPIQNQGRAYGCIELINKSGRDSFGAGDANALNYIGAQFGKFIHQQITANE